MMLFWPAVAPPFDVGCVLHNSCRGLSLLSPSALNQKVSPVVAYAHCVK